MFHIDKPSYNFIQVVYTTRFAYDSQKRNRFICSGRAIFNYLSAPKLPAVGITI